MNVLSETFHCKLQCSLHVPNAMKKPQKALHAIKFIQPYFHTIEIKTLLTSNFYSVLYCNSEIWHIPTLNPLSKQQLLIASAKALKLCSPLIDPMTSFLDINYNCERATPPQMQKYKLAILLHKLYNKKEPKVEWLSLNFQQILVSR